MAEQLTNITMHVVAGLVKDVIKQEAACGCEKCMLDAMALALNALPPKYVVTQKGDAFETFRMSMSQSRVTMYQTVLEAVQKVKERPRHNTDDMFKNG